MQHLQNQLSKRFKIDFQLIDVLSCVLTELCDKQTQLHANTKPARNKFSAQHVPAISLLQYLSRIARYSQCSDECFVLALIYIDRIIQTNPAFQVSYYNIHRLLITAVMLAAKFFDDQYYNNTYYARVGGVDAHEMNQLEVEFLFMTNFFLAVPTETYGEYFTELQSHNQETCASCRERAAQAEAQAVAAAAQQSQTPDPSNDQSNPQHDAQTPSPGHSHGTTTSNVAHQPVSGQNHQSNQASATTIPTSQPVQVQQPHKTPTNSHYQTAAY